MKVLTSMMGTNEVITAIVSDGTRYKLRREPTAPFQWQVYDDKGDTLYRPSAYREELLGRIKHSHKG